MAQLYADENFNRAVVGELRLRGHSVLTVQEAGQAGSSDSQVLNEATAMGRAVLTFNHRHFARLHRTMPAHAGIISCTDDDAGPLAARIDQAITNLPELAGRFIRITRPATP
jgi:hypothetical protein